MKRFSFARRRWDSITHPSLVPAASPFGELGEEGPHSTTAGSSLAHRVPSTTRGLSAHSSLSPGVQAGRRRRQLLPRSCHLLAAPSNTLQKCLSSEQGWPVESRETRSAVRAAAPHWCFYTSKSQVSCWSTLDGAAQQFLLQSRRKSPKKPQERPPDHVAMDTVCPNGKLLPGLWAGSSATTPSSQRCPSSEAGMSSAGPAW